MYIVTGAGTEACTGTGTGQVFVQVHLCIITINFTGLSDAPV